MDSTRSAGLHTITVALPDHEEFFITATPLPGEAPAELLARAAAALPAGAQVLTQDLLGITAGDEVLRASFGEVRWPVTRVLNARADSPAPGGTQLWALTGLPVETLRREGRVIGRMWSDQSARFCRLGALLPPSKAAARPDQARALLESMEALLRPLGMDVSHVARTWFFFAQILAWYGEFNRTRDAFFSARDIFAGLVPASTGIGGANPAGTALCGGLLAIQPHQASTTLAGVPSPLQCPALEYGSSFSRALEIRDATCRRLLVSGTASITADGRVEHSGSIDAQIERTLEVVAAILAARDMDWSHLTRAIAYIKRPQDLPAFEHCCERLALPPLPAVLVQNDVCFEDLLFELEADAISLGA